MEARKVLVGQFKIYADQCRQELAAPSIDDGREYYYQLESQLTLKEFDSLIDSLEKIDDPALNGFDTELMTNFLTTRWSRIQSTDASYCMRPDSSINEMCVKAARYFSQNADCTNDSGYRAMLMPTVVDWKGVGGRNLSKDGNMHEFVLTEDNENLIEIAEVLSNRKLATDGMYTTQSINSYKRELTKLERQLVTYHSSYTRELTNEVFGQNREQDVGDFRYNLRSAINDASYAKCVEATYRDDGYELLKSNLLSNVNTLFISFEQLVTYMACRIYRDDWDAFIKKFDQNDFAALVNPTGQSLKTTVAYNAGYNGDPKHDKAILFCFAVAYWNERSKKGEYTGIAGTIGGEYLTYPKAKKQGAIDLIKSFLTKELHGDDQIDLKKWHEFVKRNKEDFSGALKDGTVGAITAQFKKVESLHKQNLETKHSNLKKTISN